MQLLNNFIKLFQFFLFTIFDVLAFSLIPFVSWSRDSCQSTKYHPSLQCSNQRRMGQPQGVLKRRKIFPGITPNRIPPWFFGQDWITWPLLAAKEAGETSTWAKKKKMGLPWAFCCLDQDKKKKQGTDSVCLRGLKGGYPVIHTPIYSERQGSQAWNNLRPHVGTYQKTGKNRTPEWLNVYGYSGSRWRMVGYGGGWQGESGVAVGREGAGRKRMGEGYPPSVTTFAFTVLKCPSSLQPEQTCHKPPWLETRPCFSTF